MNLFACYVKGTHHKDNDLCEEYFIIPAQNYAEAMHKILTLFEEYIKINNIQINELSSILTISKQEFNNFISFPN